MFHVNPLPGRGYTRNIKSYFLLETMKKYSRLLSAAVKTGILRVKNLDIGSISLIRPVKFLKCP